MSDSPFRNVTIVGATGTLGYRIADAFLNDGSYNVKILRKKPENVNAKASSLAEKSFYEVQLPLLTAAKDAGVKRFIPSEFGSEYQGISHPFSDDKAKFRAEVEKRFDIKKKKATFFTDPNLTISTTSLHDVGKYTVESLKIPDARNARIRVAGATLSFNELLKKFEEASGSKWEVVEDREIRKRFREKIDPVPSSIEELKAHICENARFAKTDNDKFSFTPISITDAIKALVKDA
ncbi:7020_t:CDS:2 [Funneliformis caledonium]|uniref:7020_t:CDS:1 n=1 Tax=Funneliformis caledonium TaxID=1117310 RepID=A0A9N9EAZ0_9GLOM|nr:7020_t:CDS:2 [Funneliformis caledonium]